MTLTHHDTGMSASFCHWQELTDQYARQLDGLQRREPGAAAALMITRREIEICRLDVESHGATGSH